jgi:peroxiredoxin
MTLSPADPVEDFTLPDTDGNPVRLAPADADATVVAFTCNHCPYALAWHDRLNDVAREYAPRGVRLLFVNANDATRYPRDSAEAMKARVDRGEFAAPYLHDESQAVARAWGARTTPDIFVVDRDGILAYRGAPDGDHGDPALRAQWLRSALEAVLAGRPVAQPETEPVGCSIKWRA